MKQLLPVVLIALLLSFSAGCQTNPATGKSQLNMMSESQEISMGTQAQPEFIKEYGGPIPSQAIQEYVKGIGQKLAAESERPHLPWEFHALNSEAINAFALPGGKVFVTRGLLVKLENEAMLAGVLGHEVGHVTNQHIGQKMTQAMIIQGVAIGLGVAGEASDEDWLRTLGIGAQAGGTVYLLSFGRGQELESDDHGMKYMTRLGYNPVGLMQVMEMFQREMGSARPPEFLSTHPYPDTRIDQINKLIRERYPNYDKPGVYRFDQAEYQRIVLDELKRLPAPK